MCLLMSSSSSSVGVFVSDSFFNVYLFVLNDFVFLNVCVIFLNVSKVKEYDKLSVCMLC